MTWFSRNELKKLSALCDDRRYQMENVRDNEDVSYMERCLANHEAEYMKALSEKLWEVAESPARRVEIVY